MSRPTLEDWAAAARDFASARAAHDTAIDQQDTRRIQTSAKDLWAASDYMVELHRREQAANEHLRQGVG